MSDARAWLTEDPILFSPTRAVLMRDALLAVLALCDHPDTDPDTCLQIERAIDKALGGE